MNPRIVLEDGPRVIVSVRTIICVTLAPMDVVPMAVRVTFRFPASEFASVVSVIVDVDELPKSRAIVGGLNTSSNPSRDEAKRNSWPLN